MAFVIDRVDLLAYAAEDARVLDAAAGTLSVLLARAAAHYLREPVPDPIGEPPSAEQSHLPHLYLSAGL